MRDFLGRGWAFPVELEADRGRIAAVAYERDVEQSIRIILATSKGERLMRPDFGCGIHDLVFSSVNPTLIARIKESVRIALRDYEARVEVQRVTVDSTEAARGVLRIQLEYLVRATNQSGNLVFPFYFREGF